MGVAQPVDINAMAKQIAEAFIIFGSAGNPIALQSMWAAHHDSTVRAVTEMLKLIYESPATPADTPPHELS